MVRGIILVLLYLVLCCYESALHSMVRLSRRDIKFGRKKNPGPYHISIVQGGDRGSFSTTTTTAATEHVPCELLAATHTHNTLHCTCTSLHSAHNKRVMNFLDTANTIHAPRASSRFSYILRASPALFCTRILNRERAWQHLCSLLR